MPLAKAYRPDPVFASWNAEFSDPVEPADFPMATIRFRNDRAAASVGLETLTDEEWISHFARFAPLAGNLRRPLALRYHGHQFGVYNPHLGDGRGFLFAQLREAATGRLLDLGTKGSGTTPWSRAGDGRLTLKGGVREVLATAMLEALGVPTSRSFSLIETGEALMRGDEPSPTRSAVLTRLSYSHIRFGSFQRCAFFGRADLVGELVSRVIEAYFPDLAREKDKASALLFRVMELSAHLAARWMAAGFVHGVLNTDNMSITGESFDYGPYRFLPKNDPNFVAAYFDETGLYRFGRQPQIVAWNLRQLAGALTLVSPAETLSPALEGFAAAYQRQIVAAILARLGLASRSEEEDLELANSAFAALAAGGDALRWEPFFFDWFGGLASEARGLAGPRAALYGEAAFQVFREKLRAYAPDRPERLAAPRFARPEPEELLIEEIEAIWAAIAERDD
ncbi:MAG: protein adenylyltransferase SelO family protein, partial [Caulobacteraceae bacterium]